jgi:hypothetical protein
MRLRRDRRPGRVCSSLELGSIFWASASSCSFGAVVAKLGSAVEEAPIPVMLFSGPKKWLLVKNDLERGQSLDVSKCELPELPGNNDVLAKMTDWEGQEEFGSWQDILDFALTQ